MSLEMGNVWSKRRSLSQILEKPCVCSKGHIFSLIIMKLGQTECLLCGKLEQDQNWIVFGQKLGKG